MTMSDATYSVEYQKSEFSSEFFKAPNLPSGMSRREAEDHMYSMMSRNPGNRYRIVENNPESEPPDRCAYLCADLKPSHWMQTIYIVPKGNDDYWDRFGEMYPVVASCVEQVISDAGTSDADVKVIEAAAARLADYENWMMRAGHAMAMRNGKAFDRLFREMCGTVDVTNKMRLYGVVSKS